MAHPDDESDVGGTIYKLCKNGHEVAVAILVGKVSARRNLSDSLSKDEEMSLSILGVHKVYHADFPNIKTNVSPHLDIVRFIESCILDWEAEAIITHHSADVNIDHSITSVSTLTACRVYQRGNLNIRLKLLLFCESAGATEWSLNDSTKLFIPNYFIEIGIDGLDKKIQSHQAYSGVTRSYPHPYSDEVYKGLAEYRGSQCGCNYAEAYQCAFRSI